MTRGKKKKKNNQGNQLGPSPFSENETLEKGFGLQSPLSNLKQRFLPRDLWQATTGLDLIGQLIN